VRDEALSPLEVHGGNESIVTICVERFLIGRIKVSSKEAGTVALFRLFLYQTPSFLGNTVSTFESLYGVDRHDGEDRAGERS